MKKSMLVLVGLALVVATGCSSSMVRDAATPRASTHLAIAGTTRLDARVLPGEYEVVWSAPEVVTAAAAPPMRPSTRPEVASKKGKLMLADVHSVSFQ